MCPIVGLVLELTHVLTFSPKKVCPVIDSMLDLTDDIVLSSPKMCPATKPPLVADNVPRDRLHVRVLLVANVQPSRQAEALSHVVVCRRGCLVLAGDAGIISQHPLLYIYIALAWGMAYIDSKSMLLLWITVCLLLVRTQFQSWLPPDSGSSQGRLFTHSDWLRGVL